MPIIIDVNKQILTPVKDILIALQQQATSTWSGKLKDITFKANEAILTCPHHKNGMENKPSCYMMLEDEGELSAGTWHCFSCGSRGNLVKFVAEVLDTSYRKAVEWLLGFCNYAIVDTVDNVEFKPLSEYFAKPTEEQKIGWGGIPVDELRKYDYIHPYMFERKLTDAIIDKFEVGYDPTDDSLTFPVYVGGKCLFVAKRSVKGKFFTLPKIKPKPIYGVDYLTGNEVIVCESVINALTCYVYGKEAIALFGTGSGEQIDELCRLPMRHIILALDPDDAGNKGVARMKHKLINSGKLVSRLRIPEGKDINDLSKEEFDSLKEDWIFS